MSDRLDIPQGARLLVCRTDRIGDLLLALPLAESIKLRHPDCEVHMMASLYASPVVDNNPNIDGIVRVQFDQLISNGRYRAELQAKVAKLECHTAVVLYPEPHICRLLHRVGVPHRIGTSRRFHSFYFNHYIHHSRRSNRKHELEYNLDFLRFFANGATVSAPRIVLTDRDRLGSSRLLESRSIRGYFVVIHPGSGGSADRWPLENFLRLADLMMKQGVQVVITGSASEAPVIERTATQLGICVPTLGGDTDLRTLSAVLASARLVVSNSTGPLHLSAAVGTPVVGLYPSKRMMSPVRWGPVGEGHIVLQPPPTVCRCPEKRCECMRSMSVETVLAAVIKALAAKQLPKGVVS